jgi:hydroxyacylglutathione hydrolase
MLTGTDNKRSTESPMIINEYSNDDICFVQLHLGGDRNFCYLIGDRRSGAAAAVDPGFKAGKFASEAEQRGLKIELILLTHGHSDHAGKAAELARLTGSAIYAGKEEKVAGATAVSSEEDLFLGKRAIHVFRMPGHSPGHLCFLFQGKLITGDLLFCGKVGGTGNHFPGSSPQAQWESLQQILSMPEAIGIFPGHDYYGGEGKMQYSTISYEKRHNPFLLCETHEAFLHLKGNWDAYKAEHGIR